MLQLKVKKLVTTIKNLDYKKIAKEVLFLSKFFLLVITFMFHYFLKLIWRILRFIPGFQQKLQKPKNLINSYYDKVASLLNSAEEGEISSTDLIKLAVKHLSAKKNRTLITIGGMSIGFGSVIFLLSLGYGTQRLVVSRVARLNEMQQIDVSVGQASSLFLDDSSIEQIQEIENVETILPLVSIVSKVEYNNSVSDAIAYGVTPKYLEESAIQPVRGKIFEEKEVTESTSWKENTGQVAGAQDIKISSAKMYKELAQVRYSITPLVWKAVYAEPSSDSAILGYTQRQPGEQQASEVWGESYDNDLPSGIDFYGNEYSPWIKDEFPLWEAKQCNTEKIDCINGTHVILKQGNIQKQSVGYITEDNTTLFRYQIISDSGPLLEEETVIDTIQFTIPKSQYVELYSGPYSRAKEIQLFTQQENEAVLIEGELIFGGAYSSYEKWGNVTTNSNGSQMGLWIRAKFPIWRQIDCPDCAELFIKEVDNYDNQVEAYSFIPAAVAQIENLESPPEFGSVLGDATESAQVSQTEDSVPTQNSASSQLDSDQSATEAALATVSQTDVGSGEIFLGDGTIITPVEAEDGTIEWITIASDSANVKSLLKAQKITFPDDTQKTIIVNRALLSIVGIEESQAVGKKLNISLVLDSEFFANSNTRAETELTEVEIIGVIPENNNPAFYLPFNDVKSLGIERYSQLKVVTKNQNVLPEVRKNIEALGYRTSSVVDTVNSINSLFATVRILLSVLGFVALGIAALGMFNTLTVSLLEKTREVGLMKTIGMKSNEVQRLFLAESIIMGISGGFLGLFVGSMAGYLLSFAISTISVTKGIGYINLVYIPVSLALSILTLAFIVGILTGLYPSRRATKISALNALRYE